MDNLTLTGMSFEAANKQIAKLLVLFATCFLIPISLLSLIRKIINCNILSIGLKFDNMIVIGGLSCS